MINYKAGLMRIFNITDWLYLNLMRLILFQVQNDIILIHSVPEKETHNSFSNDGYVP